MDNCSEMKKILKALENSVRHEKGKGKTLTLLDPMLKKYHKVLIDKNILVKETALMLKFDKALLSNTLPNSNPIIDYFNRKICKIRKCNKQKNPATKQCFHLDELSKIEFQCSAGFGTEQKIKTNKSKEVEEDLEDEEKDKEDSATELPLDLCETDLIDLMKNLIFIVNMPGDIELGKMIEKDVNERFHLMNF